MVFPQFATASSIEKTTAADELDGEVVEANGPAPLAGVKANGPAPLADVGLVLLITSSSIMDDPLFGLPEKDLGTCFTRGGNQKLGQCEKAFRNFPENNLCSDTIMHLTVT